MLTLIWNLNLIKKQKYPSYELDEICDAVHSIENNQYLKSLWLNMSIFKRGIKTPISLTVK